MKLTVWGARGSISVSGPEYLKYGGDTTCVELETATGATVILDAGTGIRALGNKMLKEGRKEFHFLFSHAHWDHLLGFPFFKPLYRKDTTICVHGCPSAKKSVKNMLGEAMQAPHFPVNLDDVAAKLVYDDSPQADLSELGLECSSICLSHPNGGCGILLTERGRCVAFLPDNEFTFPHFGGATYDDYVSCLKGVDVLIHDAEYLPQEYESFSRGWGHSVYLDTVRLATEAKVGRLVLWHLNQDRSDEQLDEMADKAQQAAREAGSDVGCIMARTGLTMEV